MDVNGIGQNTNNINSYSSNLSEYTQTNTEVSVPQTQQVQKVETQTSEDNNTKTQEYSKKDVGNAVNKLNNFLKGDKTHAECNINEDFHTLMIKIIDDDTNQVILEVPPKKILLFTSKDLVSTF